MKKNCRSLVEVEAREEHPLLRMDFQSSRGNKKFVCEFD
jgi:hypothetical protein